jgi:hypothetical protein
MRNAARVLALVAAAGILAGCGTASVNAADVEEQAKAQFGEQFPVDSVDCDEDLPAEVDATITCVLVSDGTAFEMTVTTTEVDGGEVSFDLELTDEL